MLFFPITLFPPALFPEALGEETSWAYVVQHTPITSTTAAMCLIFFLSNNAVIVHGVLTLVMHAETSQRRADDCYLERWKLACQDTTDRNQELWVLI